MDREPEISGQQAAIARQLCEQLWDYHQNNFPFKPSSA